LERRTTYMNVSWQSTLVASQKNMLEYPAKARSAIVNAMPCLCYMNFASHFFYKPIHQISNSTSLISYALSHTVILSYLVLFKVVGHNTLCT